MKKYIRAVIVPTGEGTEDSPMRFICSSEVIDRADDIVYQEWDVADYMRNPVFLWAHDYKHPPVGRCDVLQVMAIEEALAEVGAAMKPEDFGLAPGAKVLVKDVVFDENDAFAEMIRMKYVRGFMNAVSVGFEPLEYDTEDGGGRFIRNNLLETSAVPIPMNPTAIGVRGAASSPVDDATAHMFDVMRRGLLAAADGVSRDADDGVTNFPKEGDDLKVSLRNSNFDVFDREFIDAIKADYPDIWEAGGNTKGDDQYRRLRPVVMRGGEVETETEDEAVRDREAWSARHYENHNLPGVVALAKWFTVGAIGEKEMKAVMNEAKKRFEKMTREQIAAALAMMRGDDGMEVGDACDAAEELLPVEREEEAAERAEDEAPMRMSMELSRGCMRQLEPVLAEMRKMCMEDRGGEIRIGDYEGSFDAEGAGVTMGEMMVEPVEERAEPGDLSVGDFVSWDSSGGMASGVIEEVSTEEPIEVPESDFTIEASEEDPAALIRVYEEEDGGWIPTDTMVGLRFSALTKIDPLPAPDEDDEEGVEEAADDAGESKGIEEGGDPIVARIRFDVSA